MCTYIAPFHCVLKALYIIITPADLFIPPLHGHIYRRTQKHGQTVQHHLNSLGSIGMHSNP